MTTALGWLGNASLLLFCWGLAGDQRWPFLCGLLGSLFWASKGIMTHQWDLVFINTTMAGLNLRAYLKKGLTKSS